MSELTLSRWIFTTDNILFCLRNLGLEIQATNDAFIRLMAYYYGSSNLLFGILAKIYYTIPDFKGRCIEILYSLYQNLINKISKSLFSLLKRQISIENIDYPIIINGFCVICYDQPQPAISLKCGHILCKYCVYKLSGIEPRCPICRCPIKRGDSMVVR